MFHHESDLRGLDPQVSYDEISGMAMKLLYEGLIDYDGDLQLVPRIAEALPEISADGKKGEIIGTGQLEGEIMSSPAIVDGALFVRSDGYLWKIAAP